MKTKVDKVVDKKGKKRLLSETSSPVKSNLKQEGINELKKSPKKVKLAGIQQNENPTSEEKVLTPKVGNKIKQQSSIVKPLEAKKDAKEKTELTAKSKKETGRSKRRRPYNYLNLNAEQITKKIAEIKSRETLSKRAKKILGILNRKLRECGNKPGKLDTVEKKSKKAEHPTNVLINNKKAERANILENEKKTKDNKKVEKYTQNKNKLQEEDDDDDDDDDSDVEEESEEDESDESKVKNELSHDSFMTDEKDDESDEDEEDEEAEGEEDEDDDEEIESEEDEEEVQGEEDEDEDDEDDEEDEEDDEDDDEEDENKKTIIKKPILSEVKNKKIQNTNEQEQNKNKQERNNNKQEQNKNKQEQNKNKQSSDNEQKGELKKKRYVLFVGNLPLNINEDEIKQHFLTKIDTITSIRIPTKPDKTPRGFAYVEVTNNVDFEKGLSLNHTFLKKRRINVEYSIPSGGKGDATKKFIVAKNMKLQALQKAGKLAGGNQKRKPFKREK